MALITLLLGTSITTYAYWTDKVELKLETPITYPVKIELTEDEKPNTQLEASYESPKPQTTPTKAQANEKPSDEVAASVVEETEPNTKIPTPSVTPSTGESNDTSDTLAIKTS